MIIVGGYAPSFIYGPLGYILEYDMEQDTMQEMACKTLCMEAKSQYAISVVDSSDFSKWCL